MHRLLVGQKLWSMRGRFDVSNEDDGVVYTVEGSLFQIPKQFTIADPSGRERARVWKKPVSWQPRFFVEVDGVEVATIEKQFTFFRPRYEIHGPGLTVSGDFWDMSFEIQKDGVVVGRVDKKWAFRDKYVIEVERPEDELLTVGIVLAIDYVKQSEQSAAASAGSG
ncbi:LURP-one-related family protein [Isoptericola halotolerans]|uniref:Uncharacterized protein YxjI n=1 Tax=Isoptericola halotolerans TaxID=300560 RepID=A0ABX2A559_9MICO|nr:LURP-one-related family protein [Isoptericola halotolerans]NOV97845.1 uncharacterized protein YxjI [Isoptericola halotolerans]